MTALIKIVMVAMTMTDGDGFDSDQHGGSIVTITTTVFIPVRWIFLEMVLMASCDGQSEQTHDDGFDSDCHGGTDCDDDNTIMLVRIEIGMTELIRLFWDSKIMITRPRWLDAIKLWRHMTATRPMP